LQLIKFYLKILFQIKRLESINKILNYFILIHSISECQAHLTFKRRNFRDIYHDSPVLLLEKTTVYNNRLVATIGYAFYDGLTAVLLLRTIPNSSSVVVKDVGTFFYDLESVLNDYKSKKSKCSINVVSCDLKIAYRNPTPIVRISQLSTAMRNSITPQCADLSWEIVENLLNTKESLIDQINTYEFSRTIFCTFLQDVYSIVFKQAQIMCKICSMVHSSHRNEYFCRTLVDQYHPHHEVETCLSDVAFIMSNIDPKLQDLNKSIKSAIANFQISLFLEDVRSHCTAFFAYNISLAKESLNLDYIC
jgi:hypothetical protein